MVYCRVSNKVRFFIYNIYTVNLPYRSKKNHKKYNNNNKYRVYTYLQLCLLFKTPLHYDRRNCTQLCF